MNDYSQKRSMENIRLDRAIRPIFVSLPMPRGVEAEMLLAGYYLALQDEPIEALESVVAHLVKGTWHEEVKFCPRPPELANMVRQEQRRVDAISRPRLPPPAAMVPPFKDLRIAHRQRADELAAQGFVLVGEGVTAEAFGRMAKNRTIPAGSRHLWAIDEVWAPRAAEIHTKHQEIAA